MDLLLFFLPQEKIRLPLITIPEEIEIHTTIIRIYATCFSEDMIFQLRHSLIRNQPNKKRGDRWDTIQMGRSKKNSLKEHNLLHSFKNCREVNCFVVTSHTSLYGDLRSHLFILYRIKEDIGGHS